MAIKQVEQNEMIKSAKEGNEEAFAKLCEQVGSQVLYVCLKTMGNQHDGEDAAQEVFIRMKKTLVN